MSEQITWQDRPPRPDLLWVGRYKIFEVQGTRRYGRPVQYKRGRYNNTSHSDLFFPVFTGISKEEMHQRKKAFYEFTDRIMMNVDWNDDGESDDGNISGTKKQEPLSPTKLSREHGSDDDDDKEYYCERWDRCDTSTHTILASSSPNVPTITLTEEHRDWSPVRKTLEDPTSYDVPWRCQDAGDMEDPSVWYDTKRHCFRKGMTAFVPWSIIVEDNAELLEFQYDLEWYAEERFVPAQINPNHPYARSVGHQNHVNYHHLLTSALPQSPSSTSSSCLTSPASSKTSSSRSSTLTRSTTDASSISLGTLCHSSIRATPSAPPVSLGMSLPTISIGQTPFSEADGEIWQVSNGKKWIKRGLKKALVKDNLAKEAKESRDQLYNYWTLGLYKLIGLRRV